MHITIEDNAGNKTFFHGDPGNFDNWNVQRQEHEQLVPTNFNKPLSIDFVLYAITSAILGVELPSS